MQERLFIVFIMLWTVVCGGIAADKFVLVIDAGHGGKDTGAPGKRSVEKNINLNVALAFGKYVERNCPDVKVVYTRKTDVFVELNERANIANRNKADLFISIHTNALDGGKIARGFQTYTMGMHNAAENLNVAKRENSVILIEKNYKQRYAGFDPKSSESYIMFELMQDKNMANSVDLAKTIQSEVCQYSGRLNKGVHQAGLLVLRETSMPGCLIELGFITTPDEEDFLNTKDGQDKLAKGIYNAFVKYKKKYGRRKVANNEDQNKEDELLLAENIEESSISNLPAEDIQVKEMSFNDNIEEQDRIDSLSAIFEEERLQSEIQFVEQRTVRGLPSSLLVSPPSLLSQKIPDNQNQMSVTPTVTSPPESDNFAKEDANNLKSEQLLSELPNEKHEESTVSINDEDKISNNNASLLNNTTKESNNVVDNNNTQQIHNISPQELTTNKISELPDSSSFSNLIQSSIPINQPLFAEKSSLPDESSKMKNDSIATTINNLAIPTTPQLSIDSVQSVEHAFVSKQNESDGKTTKTDKIQQPVQRPQQIAKVNHPIVKPASNSINSVNKEKTPGKTIFKVQIFSSSEAHAMDTAYFKGMKGIENFHENGMVKYTVGSTDNFAEIQELRTSLVGDFPGAFIIAFKDEKKIPLQDAIAEYRKHKNTKR